MPEIRLKRAYDPPAPEDGLRILVERLWPRGVSKEHAALDSWNKDVAPSGELRRWFHHDPDRWKEFQKRYRAELQAKKEAVEELRRKCRNETVTLIYASRDEQHNGALALKTFLEDHNQRTS
jgi:uncharacterized protein YeaO (DUF488 family)